ncbi:M23 family metallopeptidase [Aldersonia sp. NBC_00410]|uniref:M23 family metallopeptidase n=1 Tax=Aldersonia sp. NBC_00410 TaxID=2975954 RepID=UPI002252E9EB|nr:M23 family metallopeptidase [Aldersonia sp. NBC_00410]MCX5045790.1 M23 family metallopeptidase [Aldersonia sp. NBC_00410]
MVGAAVAVTAAMPAVAVAAGSGDQVALLGSSHPMEAATPAIAQQAQAVDVKLVADQRAQFEAVKAAEIEAHRPKSLAPVPGLLSSTFGMRWGAMHAGIDFAEPLGTPIGSVTDGVIMEAGPASGFGLWVRVQQDDGTVGVYGHVDEILAGVGQHVRAGDIIATVGNRGQSTGPHLHYEVWLPGNIKVDPLPWLAARGVQIARVDLSS